MCAKHINLRCVCERGRPISKRFMYRPALPWARYFILAGVWVSGEPCFVHSAFRLCNFLLCSLYSLLFPCLFFSQSTYKRESLRIEQHLRHANVNFKVLFTSWTILNGQNKMLLRGGTIIEQASRMANRL